MTTHCGTTWCTNHDDEGGAGPYCFHFGPFGEIHQFKDPNPGTYDVAPVHGRFVQHVNEAGEAESLMFEVRFVDDDSTTLDRQGLIEFAGWLLGKAVALGDLEAEQKAQR